MPIRLKELREEKGLTQKQVAEQFNVSVSCYAGWEQGYRHPNLNELIRLSRYFEVPADYLLGIEDAPESRGYAGLYERRQPRAFKVSESTPAPDGSSARRKILKQIEELTESEAQAVITIINGIRKK